jgi:hypothetical protein
MKLLNYNRICQKIWTGLDERLYNALHVISGNIRTGIINQLWSQTYQEELRDE